MTALKALHLISLVAWFAGLFYIFRLYVYHRANCNEAKLCSVFETMERRLLKAIIYPAMIMTLGTGSSLVFIHPYVLSQPWFWMKMSLVAWLLFYQGLAQFTCLRFQDKDFYLSEARCRLFNELPTLVLIGAVFLVVLKPGS